MKTVAFVPIRLNSKRVVGKNLRLLGGKPLLVHIFERLIEVDNIDEVYAFCSSEEIIPYLPQGVKFLQRDVYLDSDTTLGAEIYNAFCNLINADVYVLAHATSPFIKSETIHTAVDKVQNHGYDSSFSAEQIKTFAWFKGNPLNYSLDLVPRTQDLEPVYIETSAFYIFKKFLWNEKRQRIGEKPYIQVIDKIEGIDIDYPDDYEFAEVVIKNFPNNI